ncbi:YfjL-like protein [Niallia sp. FSL M8-0099]|jgi:hypothetical protein|uniref:YfjL-like protein n=1 Tax=Niallia sp. FSL M8-0099 TaxID=2954519 RepID=UPI0030F58AD8
MLKKKIIYILIAASLIAIVIGIYIKAAGNPYEISKARDSLKSYLVKTYPEKDLTIKWYAKYSSNNEDIRFEVLEKEPLGVETTYKFNVHSYEPYDVFIDTIHDTSIDKKTSQKLNKQAEQYILKLVQKNIPELHTVATDIEVYNNDVKVWTPKLKTPRPFLIMMEIEKDDLTKEQMLQQAKAIQQQLNSESIDYHLAEVGYSVMVNSEKSFDEYVSFTPQQKLMLKDIN